MAPPFLTDVQLKTFSMKMREFLGESHAKAAAAAVMKLVRPTEFPRAPGHYHYGRDANTPGNENVVARMRFIHVKVVSRPAHPQYGTGSRMLVSPGGASPTVRVFEYGHFPRRTVGGVAAQRVLARQARVTALYINMRARRPLRQGGTMLRHQTQHQDVAGDLAHAFDSQIADSISRQGRTQPHFLRPFTDGRISSLGIFCRIPFHNQRTWAAEGQVMDVFKLLRRQRHRRHAAG